MAECEKLSLTDILNIYTLEKIRKFQFKHLDILKDLKIKLYSEENDIYCGGMWDSNDPDLISINTHQKYINSQDAEKIFSHEIGHFLWNKIGFHVYTKDDTSRKNTPEFHMIYKYVDLMAEKSLSKFNNSIHEYMAEAFALYIMDNLKEGQNFIFIENLLNKNK